MIGRLVLPRGSLSVCRPSLATAVVAALSGWEPRSRLGKLVREAAHHLPPDLARELIEAAREVLVGEARLYGRLYHQGRWYQLGLLSRKVVTNAGVNAIVDAFQNLFELENFKYHALGTGTAAESASDTALQSELTTQYNPDNTRATGTLGEGSSANIFKTVGTNSFDGSAAITEHGVFNQAATGGGVLLDRSVFAAINVVSGDQLQSTYELTLSAGG